MWSRLLPLLALCASVHAVPFRRHEEPKPVCIIGAGPAGLSAGARLEQKGIKAIIFDSQAEVGGKCQAYYDEALVLHGIPVLDAADHPHRGIFHPLGAAFFSNATYPETLKIWNQTDVAIEPFKLAGAREQFR